MRLLSWFQGAVQRQRAQRRIELFAHRHLLEASLFEDRAKPSCHVVACIREPVQDLDDDEQPTHQLVGRRPPVGNMQFPAGLEHAPHFLSRPNLVCRGQVVEEETRNDTIELPCRIRQVMSESSIEWYHQTCPPYLRFRKGNHGGIAIYPPDGDAWRGLLDPQGECACARRQIQHDVFGLDRGLHNKCALHLVLSRGDGNHAIVERRQPVVGQSRDIRRRRRVGPCLFALHATAFTVIGPVSGPLEIDVRYGAIASSISLGIGVATSTAVTTSTTRAAVSSSVDDFRRRAVAVSLPRIGSTRLQL